jgi:PST family polysaccharide transporter
LLNFRAAVFFVAAMMIIKSLAGLAALKVQASLLLPGSFAVLSQFMTVAGLITNVSSAAITTGMTVLLARSASVASTMQLIRTGQAFAVGLSCLISIVCVVLFFFGTDLLSIDPLPRYLFLVLAAVPWLVTRSSIAQARLTSSFHLNRFATISNGSAIAVAALTIAFTFAFGLTGSAIAVAIGPMVAASILLLLSADKALPDAAHRARDHDARNILELLRFSSVMLMAISAVPLSQLVVRESMISAGANEQAGYWSSAVRLSDVYMQFFGLLLMSYVLPKISAQSAAAESKRMFAKYLGYLSLIGAVSLTTVYVLREQIVVLALAPEFRPTIGLMPSQLGGDFFRIILSFFFWFAYGQNLRVLAAAEEVFQAFLFYAFFTLGHGHNVAQGAVEAHLFASATNTAIIGSCLLFVFLRRR